MAEEMDKNNEELWEDFLQPLKGLKSPKEQPHEYETINARACLSTDLAYLLNSQGEQKSETVEKKHEGSATDPVDTAEECNQEAGDQREENKQLEANAHLNSKDMDGNLSEEKVRLLQDMMRDKTATEVKGEDKEPKYRQRKVGKSENVNLEDMKRKMSKEESFSSKTGNESSKCVSAWTPVMFSQYFDFRTNVKELELASSDVDDGLTEEIYCHYENALKVLVNDITLQQDSPKYPFNESFARILFDGLLLRLCCKHDIRLQTEFGFQLPSLPSGRFDYLMSTKSRKPFGCIETKSSRRLNATSFVQAVLRLCSLQQIASQNGIDIASTPVFCILTDSFRFVFIQLQGRELRVEHEPKSERSNVPGKKDAQNKLLKLRRLDAKNDFTNIIGQISRVIEMSLQLIK